MIPGLLGGYPGKETFLSNIYVGNNVDLVTVTETGSVIQSSRDRINNEEMSLCVSNAICVL